MSKGEKMLSKVITWPCVVSLWPLPSVHSDIVLTMVKT